MSDRHKAGHRLRRAGLPIGPTVLGILIALGGNFLFEGLKGPINSLYVVLAGLCLTSALVIYLIYYIFVGEADNNTENYARTQIQHALKSILVTANAALTSGSGIQLNIRYYRHRKVGIFDRLYQDKEIHSLSVMLSSEEPFTFIDVNEKNMVMGQAFTTRSHRFLKLPADHFDTMYSDDARKAIDPKQKWFLAIPVLALEQDGTIADDAKPYGIIAIYSNKDLPLADDAFLDRFIYLSLQCARAFAAILSLGRALGIA